ncbi:hypothetical protein AB0H49_34350 [Nocardia sp. NPDC050713]|uniref:hypothetical protein n=1 Tax=Nocardia sp. NPDC050713 TaxID=3154511 RepID=UPI0033C18001
MRKTVTTTCVLYLQPGDVLRDSGAVVSHIITNVAPGLTDVVTDKGVRRMLTTKSVTVIRYR